MFVMTAQEWVDKFRQDMESGWLRPDDLIGMEYWSYDDVKCEAEMADIELSDEAARKVWDQVTNKIRRYDYVDNDIVQDEILMTFAREDMGDK